MQSEQRLLELESKGHTGDFIGMDDLLRLLLDAVSEDAHDAAVILPFGLGHIDGSFIGVIEVLEDLLLVKESHCQHSVQPRGHLL